MTNRCSHVVINVVAVFVVVVVVEFDSLCWLDLHEVKSPFVMRLALGRCLTTEKGPWIFDEHFLSNAWVSPWYSWIVLLYGLKVLGIL